MPIFKSNLVMSTEILRVLIKLMLCGEERCAGVNKIREFGLIQPTEEDLHETIFQIHR